MKYRDVPWAVALTLLPGKIIGTFCIKPPIYIKSNFSRLLRKYGPSIITCVMMLMILLSAFMLADHLADGRATAWLKYVFSPTPDIIVP